MVAVKREDGVATLSRKSSIGSPRDGDRRSVAGDILDANIGSAVRGEADTTVVEIVPV